MHKSIATATIILLCASCAKAPNPTQNAFYGAQDALNQLDATTAPECKNNAWQAQINAISAQIATAQQSCEKDLLASNDAWRVKLRNWQIACVILVAVLLFLLKGKVVK